MVGHYFVSWVGEGMRNPTQCVTVCTFILKTMRTHACTQKIACVPISCQHYKAYNAASTNPSDEYVTAIVTVVYEA